MIRKWIAIGFYLLFLVFLIISFRQYFYVSNNMSNINAAASMAAGAFLMIFSLMLLVLGNSFYRISDFFKQ